LYVKSAVIERLHEEEDGERLVLRFIGPDRKSSQSTVTVALLHAGHLLAREVVFKVISALHG
jgi:hypothetical protein